MLFYFQIQNLQIMFCYNQWSLLTTTVLLLLYYFLLENICKSRFFSKNTFNSLTVIKFFKNDNTIHTINACKHTAILVTDLLNSDIKFQRISSIILLKFVFLFYHWQNIVWYLWLHTFVQRLLSKLLIKKYSLQFLDQFI